MPSRVTDLNHKSTRQHPCLPMPAFPPSALASEGYRRPSTPPKAQGVEGASQNDDLARAINPNSGARADPAPPLAYTHGTPKDMPPDRPKK